MGTSELTLNNLASVEEQYPGAGLLFSQEWNIIWLWRALTTALPAIPSELAWVSPYSTVFCWVGTAHVPQNDAAIWVPSWDAGRMSASHEIHMALRW